ncbi:hypothetical protein [Trueperella pyogenes]|uniref:hypothetical protein n=1 Tax=Trueperella pyogenes TaxID=1661 RepID=UPI00345CCD11
MRVSLADQRKLLADPEYGVNLRRMMRQDVILKYSDVLGTCSRLQWAMGQEALVHAVNGLLDDPDPEHTLQLYRRLTATQKALIQLEKALSKIEEGTIR